jgi:hypothetical protein
MIRNTLALVEACYDDTMDAMHAGYSVRWNGWIPTAESERIVGSWVGYPTASLCAGNGGNPLDHARWPFLVSVVNGRAVGSYLPGATWDIRPPDGASWLVLGDFQVPDQLAVATRLRAGAKIALIRMIDLLHQGRLPKRAAGRVKKMDR